MIFYKTAYRYFRCKPYFPWEFVILETGGGAGGLYLWNKKFTFLADPYFLIDIDTKCFIKMRGLFITS